MHENPVSRFQTFPSRQQVESTEHRDLFAHYAALKQIPVPIGTWESSKGNEDKEYLLKINRKGGFVLSINTHKEKNQMAMTGIFKVKGSTLIAENMVGSAKRMMPKNGHLIVKSFSGNEMEIIEPHTLNIIKLKLS